MNYNPYQELANAIVLQAVDEYRLALRDRLKYGEGRLKEIEVFFFSGGFSVLTNLNPRWLVARLKQEVRR